eukprot:TRINITY_DN24413_c0_g1_i1.p1 TRINITY_DN24413_c0_g1~~TRINITY_DN24413_c0_g1_i1.p1  ORF type:complete len:889 (-),score=156.04 TRINITY_DN24413_c0_g1_i1:15-2651(-)
MGLNGERLVGSYVQVLQRQRNSVLVLAFWLACSALLLVFGALPLLGLCHDQFLPPPGSESEVARTKMHHYFGDYDSQASDVLYFEARQNRSVFADGLLRKASNYSKAFLQERLAPSLHKDLRLTGYFELMDRGAPFAFAASSFVSSDNVSSFILLQYPKNHTRDYGRAIQDLIAQLQEVFVASGQALFIGGAGTAVTALESSAAAAASIQRMDSLSLPVAFVILAVSLKSVRLLLVPLATLVVSMTVAFGSVGILAQLGLTMSATAPPVMMSIVLAISVDYALFLLHRYKEELDSKERSSEDLRSAVASMLLHSGHTIIGSGFTLALCFLSLLFFPIQLMQSIGIGVIVAICACIVVNLTFVPACIFALPTFFSNFGMTGKCFRKASPSREDRARSPARTFEEGLWYQWATFSTSRAAFCIAITIITVGGYVGLRTFLSLEKSMDTFLMTPRGSEETLTMKRFGQSFSRGQTGPYQLLLIPASSQTIYEDNFWSNATAILQSVTSNFTGDSAIHGTIASPLYTYNLNGKMSEVLVPMRAAEFFDPAIHSSIVCSSLPQPLGKDCEKYMRTKQCTDLALLANALAPILNMSSEVVGACKASQMALHLSMSPKRDALYATLTPSDEPGSKDAVAWAQNCRSILSEAAGSEVEAHLSGFTPEVMDTIDDIYSRMPGILAMTLGCCLILVGLLTVSLVFGAVSVAMIGWTIVVVFAIGIAVYQNGIFGPSAPQEFSDTGGLAWMVPALTFTVILGLGLDYDIFLLGRICEYRLQGKTDRQAFVLGVAKTGPVITSAGIIMAVAFSGLMLSSIPMLNQVALLLVSAVLLDTFFIRSFATPALHAPLRGANWWPRKVPLPVEEREHSERRLPSLRSSLRETDDP